MADGSFSDKELIDQPKNFQRVTRRSFISTFNLENWPVYLLPVICVGVYLAQIAVPLPMEIWGFSGKAMDEGHYATVFTSMFMHGSPLHIFMNMSAYFSIAPLVGARFGKGWRALLPFYIFFVLCGLAGNGLFWLLHPHDDIPVVGASGAIYGLMAALFRLNLSGDKLKPLISRQVFAAWQWLIVSNLVVILYFGGPAILLQFLRGEGAHLRIPVAWEAHVGGFVAGLILIGIMAGRQWPGKWRAGITAGDIEDMAASPGALQG